MTMKLCSSRKRLRILLRVSISGEKAWQHLLAEAGSNQQEEKENDE